MRALTFAIALGALAPAAGRAQAYRASTANPQGEQLVAVYISSSTCIGNRAVGLREAIDTLKVRLQARAAANGQQFRALGVALDWSPTIGLSYLAEFGPFDELNVGHNWFGLGTQALVWSDSAVRPSIPQVLIYRQRVSMDGPRATFGPRTVLRQIIGGDSIVAWTRSGALLP